MEVEVDEFEPSVGIRKTVALVNGENATPSDKEKGHVLQSSIHNKSPEKPRWGDMN